MRNFRETPEPKGKVGRRKGHSFVVQKHDATRLHYDFRLELDGVLLSWAVTRGPSLNPADKRLAVHVEDHPLSYGGFEGIIPSGYGAGTVILWDNGTWEPEEDPHEGVKKGSLKFTLHGKRLKGSFALVRMKPREGEKRENWLLIKHRDKYASEETVAVDKWTKSVKSGRTIDQMAKAKGVQQWKSKGWPKAAARKAKPKPTRKAKKARRTGDDSLPRRTPWFVAPQLAQLRDSPPPGDDWLHEVKYDGYRIIAVIHQDRVRLFTRNKLDWTARYRRVAEALADLDTGDCVLDGELVAIGRDGKANFNLMNEAAKDSSVQFVYYLFDLLNEHGRDTRGLPQLERKARLKQLIGAGSEAIHYSDHVSGNGDAVQESACKIGLEGVVSKKADAPYSSGRGGMWIKSKCTGQDEFVIGGYRLSNKAGRAFRSLLLGEFENGKLIYRGRVGTGFNEETFATLMPKLERLKRKTSPFAETPAEARNRAVWVSPKVVVQVAYMETTPDGHLRHPSYLGLREDKPAQAVKTGTSSVSAARSPGKVKRSTGAKGPIAIGGIRITSPEKILWPEAGITKRDLAEYYEQYADRLLPFVQDRPLSLVRCPEGYQGECFFQKHHNPSTPKEIETVTIKEKAGGSASYLVIRNKAALIGVAQIGGLELHVWGSRADSLEKPERIVFDLDPDEGLSYAEVKKAAGEVRDVLQSLGLESFALLTGGKGVHVVVPIARTQPWPHVKAFASGLARTLAASAPDRYVAQASKAKREGRTFIDWLRNERGATAIAPFSPRRRTNAPVATPVSWEELAASKAPNTFTMKTIGARLAKQKSDPWKGYFDTRQSLKAAAIKAVS